MQRNNRVQMGRQLAAHLVKQGSGLLLVGLLCLLASCTDTASNIGVGLPDANANTGAYLVDTLTVRASTVLRDSVVTSTSSYLLVGRYTDPQLGVITAKSYLTLGLGDVFTPDQNQVTDSLVLQLRPDTYRYGDTLKTQTLVNVQALKSFIPTTQFGFASPKLTDMSNRLGAVLYTPPAPRRARPNLNLLRLRLDKNFGITLMNEFKAGLLNTQENLDALHPGLALLPGSTDDAALVRFNGLASDASMILYYHDPSDPGTALSHTFPLATGRHFYQGEVTGRPPALASLKSLQQVDASLTGQQTYIQGMLGLQTKLEIPYLGTLRRFGQNLVLTSATMTVEIPTATTAGTNLAPPTTLAVSTTDQNNHQGTTFVSGVGYNPAVVNRAGDNQAGYTWSVLSYCNGVLTNAIPNTGMLVNTVASGLPERVVLGAPNRATNKLQLRVYLISNN